MGQVNVHSNGGHAAQTSSCDTDTQIVNTEKETFDPFSLIDESISSAPEPIVQNKPPSLDPFAVLDGLDFNAPAPAVQCILFYIAYGVLATTNDGTIAHS